MYLSPRHAEIIQMAKEAGRVLVDDLAAHFEVTPQTIRKDVHEVIEITSKEEVEKKTQTKKLSRAEREELIKSLTAQMKEAAKMLEFEHAAFLRDEIKKLKDM